MTEGSGSRPYRPKMADVEWTAIAGYVHDVVARAEPHVTYNAQQLYPVVARLTQFAHAKHMPLEDETVLDPFTVERFVQFHLGSYNRASRNSMRARIRRVSEALLGESASIRTRALGKAEASRPYTPKEIAELDGWALAQPSEERCTSARALLALGLGAGLTGAEIIALRGRHVHTLGQTTQVEVAGADERVVPVLPEWADELNARVAVIDEVGWVFRSEQRGGNINLITDFVSRNGPHLPLQARRMRATWLVRHLEAGTPVKTLLRIAGLRSAEALDRVLPFVNDAP
jgi:integrase